MMCLSKLWRLTIGNKIKLGILFLLLTLIILGRLLPYALGKAPLKLLPFFQYKNALDIFWTFID
jgi:hypothetical protein